MDNRKKDLHSNDIPEVPEQILEAASRGKLAIFIGAGVSRIIGCPSWEEFAKILLNDLCEKNVIDYFEKEELSKFHARKVLSICDEIYKKEGVPFPDFKEIFRGNTKIKEKYEIFKNLYSMNAIYVTTNYDDHLDEEAHKGRPMKKAQFSRDEPIGQTEDNIERGEVIYREKELLVSNLSNGKVIHLHGSVQDPLSMIVSLSDYMNHYYGEKPRVPDFLKELFTNYTVLFIGYGLEEYEILEFMISKIPRTKKSISHYILLPFFVSQKNIVNYQKKYFLSMGIELRPYFIDKSGHSHLDCVIKEWARQIGPISKPQTFLDKIRIIDEVL